VKGYDNNMSPLDPASHRPHQRLTELRNSLLQHHKVLLDSERETYERDVERVTSPNHLLSLVLHDPWFSWLRELSQLVVLIDETLDADEEPLTTGDAARLIEQARQLLTPEEGGAGFARRYFEALQRDPDVVIAHSRMMKFFAALG
jgi:hypothetical protein